MLKRKRMHERVSDGTRIFARIFGEFLLVKGLEFDLIECTAAPRKKEEGIIARGAMIPVVGSYTEV